MAYKCTANAIKRETSLVLTLLPQYNNKMNVTNINDKREFNKDGTYNGAYWDMAQVPKSLYSCMIESSQQILPSVNKHVIAQNVKKAKQNARDPKAYRHHMNQAALYKRQC